MSGVAIGGNDELVLCFCLNLKFCIHVFVFASSFFFYKIQDATSALVSTDAGGKILDCTPGTSLRTKISSYAEQISAAMHTFFYKYTLRYAYKRIIEK